MTNANFKSILHVRSMVDCILGYMRRKIRTMITKREKITWIFRTDPETRDLFHMAYHRLSFNPERIKYQFFLWRLEYLGLTAFSFKNSLRCKQIVLHTMHMHHKKPRGEKKKKKTLPLQDAWQLTLAMSAIFWKISWTWRNLILTVWKTKILQRLFHALQCVYLTS